MTKHPAKYNQAFIPIFAEIICTHIDKFMPLVLDPMAGVGTIHELRQYGIRTHGVEIEPEWAGQSKHTIVGDILDIELDDFYDAIIVSPTYGNRMADNRKIKNDSTRHTYKTYLGHDLNPNNSGKLQIGQKYRDFHVKAWQNCDKFLKNDGLFVLNCKNHVRNHQIQQVTEWHIDTLIDMNYEVLEHWQVELNGNQHGRNWQSRDWYESIVVLRKIS